MRLLPPGGAWAVVLRTEGTGAYQETPRERFNRDSIEEIAKLIMKEEHRVVQAQHE